MRLTRREFRAPEQGLGDDRLSVNTSPGRRRMKPGTWRVIGYVRDIVIILGIALGALYLSWHPEKFDAFMYWLIGYRYRH
jgi:hypothetical protein